MTIVVVGAGAAGLAAARCLHAAGRKVLLLDKGRGPGGRLASRRNAHGVFDHGVAEFVVDTGNIDDLTRQAQAHGALASSGKGWMGVPRMSAFAGYLAEGLDLRCGVQITRIDADGTAHDSAGDCWPAEAVIVTVPPPQALPLIPDAAQDCHSALAAVRYAPCWSLMVVLDASPPVAPRAAEPLQVIRREADRPGREDAGCWVALATGEWSVAHLDAPAEAVQAELLATLCAQLGVAQDAVAFAQLHRWRYARALTPVGVPCLRSAAAPILFAGDGVVGDGVAAALGSGEAAARRLLAVPQGASAMPK